MARDTMRLERLLIVVRVTHAQLQSFPANSWVAVEAFTDETSARARFHVLRLPLERIKVGAVLVHALTTPNLESVEYQKTVISKDADYWELQHSEIVRASEEQQAEWNEAVISAIAEAETQRKAAVAAAAQRKALGSTERHQGRQRSVVMAGCVVFAAVCAIGFTVSSLRDKPAQADHALQQARRGFVTVIMADRNDPTKFIEYELKDDGTRRVVRRLTQAEAVAIQADGPLTTESHNKPTSLVDALNHFFAVRD